MVATLRRTFRALKRSPVYFATATMSLAVGLGLCTATFLFIDSIRNPHLPYADVDRLFFAELRLGNQRTPPSLAELQRSMIALPALEGVATKAAARQSVSVHGRSQYLLVIRTTPGFFGLIGIAPRLGRLPNAEEARTQRAAMVTQTIWHDAFGDAKEIGDARMLIGDQSYAIVGVLPRGADLSFNGDVFLPFASDAALETLTQRSTPGQLDYIGSSVVVVKLRPHVKPASLDAQLATIAAGFTSRHVASGTGVAPYALQLRSVRPRSADTGAFGLLMLLIGVGVLAIAATNVAALSLARGLTRKRDYALRIALGASRGAIAGEVFAEIGVISAIGAAGGMVIAPALIGALTHIVPAEFAARWYAVPEFSARLFGFSAAALVAAISIAGAAPAWRASRVNPADPLKDGAGTTTGRSKQEFRVLVIGELAVSMVLLMLASLMTLSVHNIASYEFGYDARHLLRATAYLPFSKDTTDRPARVQARRASLDRVRAVDGVVSAATMSGVSVPDWEMTSEATRPGDQPMHIEVATNVSPAFFATLGIPISAGRDFLEGDGQQGGAVILSNRAANQLFPRGAAVGRMVKFGGEHSRRWMPVVGVVRDVEMWFRNPDGREPDPPVYVSMEQRNFDGWAIAIRPRSDDPKLAIALQATLRDALPPGGSSRVSSWVENFETQIRFATFFARLFGFIASTAMLLGAAGLFSVLSYAVSQRMREFAVRSALGATQRDLLKVVLQYALEMSLAGTAIGALLSFWASAGVSGYLFGVKNTDPRSLVLAELLLLAVTMAASLVPAYRATRADPVDVLRSS